jgi:hypothetical protein
VGRAAEPEWWDDCLRRVEVDEEIRSICVWGTVGNKTDVVLEWPTIEPPAPEEHDPNNVRALEAG